MRTPTEDEMADYKEQEAIERWEQSEARRLSDLAYREWRYPWERIAPDEEEEDEEI